MKRTLNRLATVIALIVLALVVAPRTALAVGHPTTHDIYTVGSDDTVHYLDGDPVQGIEYDEATGILTMQNYNGGPIGVEAVGTDKSEITIMVKGSNTITCDGVKHTCCIEVTNSYCSVAIRSDSGGTLTLNLKHKGSGGIFAGIFAGGGLAIGGDIEVSINVESTATKPSVLQGVYVTKGNFLIRDKAEVNIKIKGKGLEAYGANCSGATTGAFTCTSSAYITFDLTGVTGCDKYGVKAGKSDKPFAFAGTPSVLFRADAPFYDGKNDLCPAATGYFFTTSSVSTEYTPDKSMVPVYRMYNTKTSEHLYTPRKGEYDAGGYGAYADWRQEGVCWWSPTKTAPGAKPVYRLYNTKSGDHHYTTSVGEQSILIAGGDWVDEGIAFYSGGKISVYRLYNGLLKRGQHHYSTSVGECNALINDYGWSYESVGFTCLSK